VPRKWKILLLTATPVFMAFLDVTVVNIAVPSLERSFPGSSLTDISWVLNGYNIVFAALLVPLGRLADLVGRKRMFLLGLWLFLGASMACGLATSVEFLVVGRIGQAAAGAILIPSSLGLLLPEFPAEQRATATSLWAAAGGVASAAGPALGGVLIHATSWRWIFFINLPVALVAYVFARRLLREQRDEAAERVPDMLGASMFAVGAGALALAIVKGPDWGWSSGRVLGSFAVAAVLVGGFVWRSARHPAPAIELDLFRIRSFAVANGATLIFAVGFYALVLSAVLFLTEVWHYSLLQAGFALSIAPLTAALFAGAGGRVCDRYGARMVAIPGAVLFTLGTLLYIELLESQRDFLGSYVPAAATAGAGIGLTFAALSSAAVADLPTRRFATGTAINSCFRQIGAVLGIALLVAILDAGSSQDPVGSFHTAWTLVAVTGVLVTAIGALGLGRARWSAAGERVRGAPSASRAGYCSPGS